MDPFERVRKILDGEVESPQEMERLIQESLASPEDGLILEFLDLIAPDEEEPDAETAAAIPEILQAIERDKQAKLLPILVEGVMPPVEGAEVAGSLLVGLNRSISVRFRREKQAVVLHAPGLEEEAVGVLALVAGRLETAYPLTPATITHPLGKPSAAADSRPAAESSPSYQLAAATESATRLMRPRDEIAARFKKSDFAKPGELCLEISSPLPILLRADLTFPIDGDIEKRILRGRCTAPDRDAKESLYKGELKFTPPEGATSVDVVVAPATDEDLRHLAGVHPRFDQILVDTRWTGRVLSQERSKTSFLSPPENLNLEGLSWFLKIEVDGNV